MERRGKNMKKFMIFIMLFLSVISLIGCHGRKRIPLFEVPEEFDTSRNYKISFWAKNDTNSVQKAVYEKAVTEFEKLYPNIDVELVQYTDYTLIYEDVIKNIPTNTTPNICITYPDYVATYLTGDGIVAPLGDLISNPKYGLGGTELKYDSVAKNEIITKFFDECVIKGEYYLLPYVRSTEAMYVNKTYLEENGFEIPEVFSWEYVWEICKYAKEKSIAENTKMYPLIYKSTDNMFIQLCKQYGYDYTTDNGDVLFLSSDVKSMLLELGQYAKNGYFETFKRKSYPGNHFNRGQCIFAIDSTGGATWMGSDAPLIDIAEDEVVEFETLVTTIPQVNPADKHMISQGPSICLFNKEDDQEVLASWLFAQYLLTTEVQLSYAKTEGYLPVTTLAINSDEFKNYLNSTEEYPVKLAATKLVLDNTKHTFITPVFNGSSLARSASGYMIEAIFIDKYHTSKGIDELFKNVDQRYNLSTFSK